MLTPPHFPLYPSTSFRADIIKISSTIFFTLRVAVPTGAHSLVWLLGAYASIAYQRHFEHAGTEHAGFSLTRQTSLARSAKRRDVLGESHEG